MTSRFRLVITLFFLTSIEDRLRDRVDQLQFLFRGTGQLFDVLGNILSVEFGNTSVKQRLFFRCLWVMDDDFDRQVPPS